MKLSIDFETRSACDLKKCGLYVYAAHATTEIMCMAYAFDDAEPLIWRPLVGEPFPAAVAAHVEAGGEIRAWNAAFERVIWKLVLDRRLGVASPAMTQFVCTAAEARAMGLPGSLDHAGRVLAVVHAKMESGYRKMLRMSKPSALNTDGSPVWWGNSLEFADLYEYCKQDVRAERDIARKIRRLTDTERRVYLLDQRMNDRGVRLDVDLIRAAKTVATEATSQADAFLREWTGNVVTEVTKIGQLKKWLQDQGVDAPKLDKEHVKDLISDTSLPEEVRAVLRLRYDAGKSSVKKLDSMILCTGKDNRVRGVLLYHGASTGRWSGMLIQPQNFPSRGTLKNAEMYIDHLMTGDHDRVRMLAPPLKLISSLLRAMLIPSEGHEFYVVDYASIEARVVAWLAGQTDLIQMFRNGMDVYVSFASRIFGKPESEITKDERQVGKAAVLGCGYGMGPKKFVESSKSVYGVEVTEENAKVIVELYRESYGAIRELWRDVNKAAIAAVSAPGSEHVVAKCTLTMRGSYLYCVLPSGRPLAYATPRIKQRPVPWGGTQPSVEAWGLESQSRKWKPYALYGGLFVENIVQAIARDIMVSAMLAADTAGFRLLLSVHDEVIAEMPVGCNRYEEFETIIATPPGWAGGCPIAVEGKTRARYGK